MDQRLNDKQFKYSGSYEGLMSEYLYNSKL